MEITLIFDVDIDHALGSSAHLTTISCFACGFWQTPARPPMEIMLLRHGESEGNAQGRMQGRRDFPLSALGREQAARAAAFIRSSGLSLHAVYTSPLKRASETAAIVAEAGVCAQAIVDDDLPEIGAGVL